jgi:hypothetical protein
MHPSCINSFPVENLKKKHAIIWIMVNPDHSRARSETSGPILKSKAFFSTFEYAAAPNAATNIFVPLIQQLQEEWDIIYRAAVQHLNYMVGTSFLFGYIS